MALAAYGPALVAHAETSRCRDEDETEEMQDVLRLLRRLSEGQARIELMLGELRGQGSPARETTGATCDDELRSPVKKSVPLPFLEDNDHCSFDESKLLEDDHDGSENATPDSRFDQDEVDDDHDSQGIKEILERNRSQVSRLRPRRSTESKATRFLHLTSDVEVQVLSALSEESESSNQVFCMIHPDSLSHFWLDLFAFAFLLYDSVKIPLQIAWDLETTALRVVDGISSAFWAFDLVMGFFTGYHGRTAEVVMARKRVVSHYLRTTFVPICLAVISDFIPFAISNQEEGTALATVTRFAWLTRIIRLVAMIRAGRPASCHEMATEFMRRFFIERQFVVVMRILNMIAIILWLGHLSACLWRLLGSSAIRRFYEEEGLQDMESDVLFDYARALFWAMSAMIAGSSVVQPIQSAEIFFTTLCMLVGLVVCSIVIGVIADTLVESRDQNREQREQIVVLRKYLRQSEVPSGLSLSLEKQALRRIQNPRVLEESVKLLDKLSPSTREILQVLVFRPTVLLQRFIRACESLSRHCVINICSLALEREVLLPSQSAFERGNPAVGAYLVHWGQFEYLQPMVKRFPRSFGTADDMEASRSAVQSSQEEVPQCVWLCEVALFCDWEHCGSMRAESGGEVLRLVGAKFMAILQQDSALQDLTAKYARALSDAVKDNPDESFELRWPALHEDVLLRLTPEHRSMLSRAGLDMIARRNNLAGLLGVGRSWSLYRDVEDGKCDFVVETRKKTWNAPLEESVLRVLSLATLRLRREDGLQLALVGRLCQDGGEGAPVTLEPGLKLPGGAIRKDELPFAAIGRLLDGELASLKDVIITDNTKEVDVSRKPSARYQIPTQYVRHIFSAVVSNDWQSRCMRYEVEVSDRPFAAGALMRSVQRQASFRQHISLRATASTSEVMESFSEMFLLDDDLGASPKLYAWMDPEAIQRPELAEALKSMIASREVMVRQIEVTAAARPSGSRDLPSEAGTPLDKRRVYEV